MTTGKVHFRTLRETGTAYFLSASWSYSTQGPLACGLTDPLPHGHANRVVEFPDGNRRVETRPGASGRLIIGR